MDLISPNVRKQLLPPPSVFSSIWVPLNALMTFILTYHWSWTDTQSWLVSGMLSQLSIGDRKLREIHIWPRLHYSSSCKSSNVIRARFWSFDLLSPTTSVLVRTKKAGCWFLTKRKNAITISRRYQRWWKLRYVEFPFQSLDPVRPWGRCVWLKVASTHKRKHKPAGPAPSSDKGCLSCHCTKTYHRNWKPLGACYKLL